MMIFDFDGTLVSSGEDIAQSVNYMLRKLHLPEREEKEIIGFVGDGTPKLIQRSLGPSAQEKYDEAFRIFLAHYEEHMLDRTRLYEGVEEVLKHFSQKKKVIVTNKRYQFTAQMVKSLGIEKYFEEIIARDNYHFKKPDRRLILSILEKYGIEPEKTAVIGDGINDVILAKSAGAWSCAFLNGLTTRGDLLGLDPDFTCESILELKNIFQ